jgi:hypothetical protein
VPLARPLVELLPKSNHVGQIELYPFDPTVINAMEARIQSGTSVEVQIYVSQKMKSI